MTNQQRVSCYLLLAAFFAATRPARAQDSSSSTGAPGDEVMRPTRHGLHMTPRLAEAIALNFVRQELAAPLDLTADQERRLSQSIGNSLIAATRYNAQASQEFAERMLAMALENQANPQKPTADQLKEIADRGRPLMPALRGLLDGIAQSGSDVLDPEQQSKLGEMLAKRSTYCEKLDQVLERWSSGQVSNADEPFDEVQENAGQAWPVSRPTGELSQAHGPAWYEIRSMGIGTCEEFFAAARTSLGFDDEQVKRGEATLGEYRARFDSITTREWRTRARNNRIRFYLMRSLKDQPSAPFLFHLDDEFVQMTRPVKDLEHQFYKELLAIATDRQRDAFMSRVARRAALHGLAMDDVDRGLLLQTGK